jgi:hypothetical protein
MLRYASDNNLKLSGNFTFEFFLSVTRLFAIIFILLL